MISTVSQSDFIDAFRTHYDRSENFSYEGLRALFNYLGELEDSCGTQIELDIIGICCDFTEYEDWDSFKDDYPSTANEIEDDVLPEFEDGDTLTKDDYHEELLGELENYTSVIRVDSSGFIISVF